MIRASTVNETWFNPAFVVSFSWGEWESLTITMVNGQEIIAPRGTDAARVYALLTSKNPVV